MAAERQLIERAAKRVTWAAQALEAAADDLHDAAGAGAVVIRAAEAVRGEADRVERLAEGLSSWRLRPSGVDPAQPNAVETSVEAGALEIPEAG